MVYFMRTRGEQFVDQGLQRYEDQQRQRSIAALKRRAAALGFAPHEPLDAVIRAFIADDLEATRRDRAITA